MVLENFRKQHITWDKANRKVYENVRVSESDNKGRKLIVQVVNDGIVENMSGVTLSLYWETRNKAHIGLDAFTLKDAANGIYEIFYTAGMLSNLGNLISQLVLVDSTGKIVSEPFTITVFRGIDEEAIQSENSFSSLTQALIDISNLEQNYTPRLNDITAQLAQTEQSFSENKPSTYRHRNKRPVVTFLDDDGVKEVYTRLRPIFNSKNVPLSMAIITGRLDNLENTMTSDEVKTMIAEGHEALGHTHDAHSPNMTVVSEEYLINDLIENRKQLAMLGSDSRGFVYPQGQAPKWVREITQNHFDFSFGGTGINHDDNIDPMIIKRVGFGNWGSGANLEKYKNDVDLVIESGGWLVFMLHVGTGDTPEEELAILPDLIDYIKSKNIEIVNASEGYEIHGSKIFIGDKEGKYLNITNDAIHGNFELKLDAGYTITQLPHDAKSSNEGFFDYPEGQTVFRVTTTFAVSDGGFPENSAGVLITYRYAPYQGYNYQEYKLFGSNVTYTRYATGNHVWAQWVKNANANDIPIIKEEPNSRVNTDRPIDYPSNKITYTELLLDEHMLGAGFPTTKKCILITDKISSDLYSTRQELRRLATTETWVRMSISSLAWSNWVKINTTVVQ